MDAFEKKSVAPMLIGLSAGAFDSGDFIFELKLDGERCLAYLEQGNCELRNKRNDRLLPRFPELAGIAAQTRGRCILDGELIRGDEDKHRYDIMKGGAADEKGEDIVF